MYFKEEFFACQPHFNEVILSELKPFPKIKSYGDFYEGLLMCMIDMALFEIDQKTSLYVSMDAV